MLETFRMLLSDPRTSRQAELEERFEAQPAQFCEELILLLKQITRVPECYDSMQLRQCVCVFLDKKLRRLVASAYGQHKQWLMRLLQDFLADPDIECSLKRLLHKSAARLLEELPSEQRMEDFCDSHQFRWLTLLIERLAKMESQEVALMGLWLLKLLAESNYCEQHKYIVIKQVLPEFIALGGRLADRLKQLQETVDASQQSPSPAIEVELAYKAFIAQQLQQSRRCHAVENWLERCHDSISLMIEASELNPRLEVSVYMDLAEGAVFQEVLKGLLGLVLHTPSAQEGSVFSTSNLPNQLDLHLNEVKSVSLRVHSLLVGSLKRLDFQEDSLRERPLYSEIVKLTPVLLDSLFMLAAAEPRSAPTADLLQRVETFGLQTAIRSSFGLLAEMSKLPMCYSVLNDNYQGLFTKVLLPFFEDESETAEKFQEDPDSYLALCNDLVEHRDSDSELNSAANLIEAVCIRIDGALPWAVQLCVEELLASIGDIRINRESRLKVLSVLSYLLTDRPQLLQLLHRLLLRMELVGQLRPNELAWYYILLEFNIDCLHALAPSEYAAVMASALTTSDSNPTVLFVYDLAVSFLQLPSSEHLWQAFFDKIAAAKRPRYFECLESVLKHCLAADTLHEQTVMTFQEALLSRLRGELALHASHSFRALSEADLRDYRSSVRSLLVYKILNVVVEVASYCLYLQRHPNVAAALEPVLELLWADHIDFEEELVCILHSLLKSKQRLEDAEFRYLQRLPFVYGRYQRYHYTYDVVALYLTRGISCISEQPQHLNSIMELVEAGLASKVPEVVDQACLLYQLCLRMMLSAGIPASSVGNWQYMHRNTRCLYEAASASKALPAEMMCRFVGCWLWALLFDKQIVVEQVLDGYERWLQPTDSYNCQVFICGVERLLSQAVTDSSYLIARFINLSARILEDVLAFIENGGTQKVRRGILESQQEMEGRLDNPDSNVDIFLTFRDILRGLQSSSSFDSPKIVNEVTAQGTSVETLRRLSSCVVENHQPRRFLKVDRSKYGQADKLEQC